MIYSFLSASDLPIEAILKKMCMANFEALSSSEFSKIAEACRSLLHGFGPLDVLLAMEVEEIYLSIGKARVFERNNGWVETGLEISSEKCLLHYTNKLASQCGRRLTTDKPVLNAFLPNGTRIHAVLPPLAPCLQVSIRKFRQTPFSLEELKAQHVISEKASDFLAKNVANNSILVVGNTGSGKTTTLNALLSLLPVSNRFVFVEDVSELTLPFHEHKARLLAENVSLSALVYEALRMRPDRLVVSEIRNEQEVKAFANALLSGGGKTCYSTFHAASAAECLRRLELLGFHKADLDSIGLIIVQKRLDVNKKEARRITEIAKVKNAKPVVLYRSALV